jgi:aspartyl-tRNA(Asn)/glutamyl-tRNA(Gln) amidotransferase subunit A
MSSLKQNSLLEGKTIEEVRGHIGSGAVTAEECVAGQFERVTALNPMLHAFVSVIDPHGREVPAGPLKGVTIAVKDLFDLKGFPTRAGSRATSSELKQESAPVVQALERAGATVIGKTHTVEFAFGGWGTNPVLGTPWNPWDPNVHRVPGGSSSGSAVAVAAGIATAALGSDTGGSIRTPASFCGIVGVKPSPGLISKEGVFALCAKHDTVGVLTRNVADAATLLNMMALGASDQECTQNSARIDFASEMRGGLPGLRIGVLVEEELAAANVFVRQCFSKQLDLARKLGANIETVPLPKTLMDYLVAAGNIMAFESYRELARYLEGQSNQVSEVISQRILKGKTISEAEHAEDLARRRDAKREFADATRGIDALLMPTCVEAAIPVSEVHEGRVVTPYGRFANYLDLPAMSLPMGLSPEGLPLGLQVVARQNEDAKMFRVAQAIEELNSDLTGLF